MNSNNLTVSTSHVFGFDNPYQLIDKIIGTTISRSSLILAIAFLIPTFTAVTMNGLDLFLTKWVWDFPMHLIWIGFVLLLDWGTKGYVEWKKKNYQTRLALRIIPIAIFHVFMIIALHGGGLMIKDMPGLSSGATVYDVFKHSVMFLVFILNFGSAVSNAVKGGLLKHKVATYIASHIDNYKMNVIPKPELKPENL